MLFFLVSAAFVVIWQLIVMWCQIPDYLIPSPLRIAAVFTHDSAILLEHLKFTIVEWLIGNGLSVFLGFFLALLCYFSQWMKKLIRPFLVVSQSVPYLVFAPLLLLWLGLGFAPKVVLIVLNCAFPIALFLEEGLHSAKQEFRLVSKMLGFSRMQSLWHIDLPYSLPYFFSGLRISAIYAFVSAVLAELIGSEGGIGIYIIRAQSAYRTDRVLAAVLLVVLLSLASAWGVERLRKGFVFWQVARK